MNRPVKTREEGFGLVKNALQKLGASDEVKGKVIAVFAASASPWWLADADYLEYLVRQLVILFSYKFEDERMSIPANMVYLMAADKGVPSILLHWRVYLSLYRPFVRGWRLETIKDNDGRPIGMVAVILDKDGNEWRWERYYEGLHLVQRWKNRELMFAKTILKEALAVMFPELNLLPPLSTVETYDPDDIEPVPVPQAPGPNNGGAYVDNTQNSTEAVKNMAVVEPPKAKKDKSYDQGVLAREVMDKFKELSSLVGADAAKKMVDGIIKDLGAARFNDLSTEQKRFVITALESAIVTEQTIKTR